MRPDDSQTEEPFRFNKLREDAWDRFIVKSADLAAAHGSRGVDHGTGPFVGRVARGLRRLKGLLRSRIMAPEAAQSHAPEPVPGRTPGPIPIPSPVTIPVQSGPGRSGDGPSSGSAAVASQPGVSGGGLSSASMAATAGRPEATAFRSGDVIASRAARFAQAVLGAQRARGAQRVPAAAPGNGRECEGQREQGRHQPGSPVGAQRGEQQGASQVRANSADVPRPFMAEWERHFQPGRDLNGGAVWA
ncbi:hypothetical protein [Glycomyces sp. NPDC048151]|uniref:hypothetical protein n=1 Tax=Glycomyces sp. NPDC048151 TaxID=3364002 RepID=UPI00371940E9